MFQVPPVSALPHPLLTVRLKLSEATIVLAPAIGADLPATSRLVRINADNRQKRQQTRDTRDVKKPCHATGYLASPILPVAEKRGVCIIDIS